MRDRIEKYCTACDGQGVVLEFTGYRITGSGFGDCYQTEEWVECGECEGTGEIEPQFEIVAVFLDHSEDVIADGFEDAELARAEMKRLWVERYGGGQSIGPYLTHSSGCIGLKTREMKSNPEGA